MLARLQKSMKDKDQGFTLIELLVVIVIIGILAAIAIPLFLNQRQKGVDAGIKSDLKALATLQETYYTDATTYAATEATLTTANIDFKKTDGNTFQAVASATGFCIAGTNTAGSATYYYDSAAGGLVDTDPTAAAATGACAGGTFATF